MSAGQSDVQLWVCFPLVPNLSPPPGPVDGAPRVLPSPLCPLRPSALAPCRPFVLTLFLAPSAHRKKDTPAYSGLGLSPLLCAHLHSLASPVSSPHVPTGGALASRLFSQTFQARSAHALPAAGAAVRGCAQCPSPHHSGLSAQTLPPQRPLPGRSI